MKAYRTTINLSELVQPITGDEKISRLHFMLEKVNPTDLYPRTIFINDIEFETIPTPQTTYLCEGGLKIVVNNLSPEGEYTDNILTLAYQQRNPMRESFLEAKRPVLFQTAPGIIYAAFDKPQTLFWHMQNVVMKAFPFGRKQPVRDYDMYRISRTATDILYVACNSFSYE